MSNEEFGLMETQTQRGIVKNPFATNIVQAGQGRVADTQVATKEIAEVQARVALAKQFPRDIVQSSQNILNACQYIGLASHAVYSYQRGGTDIHGPSIRLAEEIVRQWGNIESGWDELERTPQFAKVRAYAWDLETNAHKQLIFVVPLQRTKNDRKTGQKITTPLSDERDIYEHIANQASRRIRNCILSLIPIDIVDSAVEQCHQTLVTKCDITPERIHKMVLAFNILGVTKKAIEERIQRKVESITPAQFVRMMEIYNSIRDEMSEPSDWFNMDIYQEESKTQSVKNKLKGEKDSLTQTQLPKEDTQKKGTRKNGKQQEYQNERTQGFRDLIDSATSLTQLSNILENMKTAVEDGILIDEEYYDLAKMIDAKSQAITHNEETQK